MFAPSHYLISSYQKPTCGSTLATSKHLYPHPVNVPTASRPILIVLLKQIHDE
jgi:hypothetical protein